eukprot:TCONS_00062930-protein
MAYFEQNNKLTFTKSFQGLRKHCYKCILILLLVTLVLFVVVSTIQNWFTVTLNCQRPQNGTVNMEHDVVFGVKDICFTRNKTIVCRNIADFHIPGTIPMDDTKKLVVLAIVFNTFALLLASSTTYCSQGFAKASVTYITLGCLALAVVSATYGLQEAEKHFDGHVIEVLKTYLGMENKCSITNIRRGFCFNVMISSTILLYMALLMYVIEWKYPKKEEIIPQSNAERLARYRLMSHISGQSVFL